MNIKKILISTSIISCFILGMLPTIVKADTITIPIKEVDGKKYVSLTDLTNASGGRIVDNSEVGVKTFMINGKVIVTNSNTPFVSVDDKTIPYESKEIDGIKVPNFQANKPKADNGEILFPVTVLDEYVGMKATDEGFVIKKEEDRPTTDQGSTNTDNTDNSGNTNTGGSSNGGGSSNTGSSSNSGGSSNTGGSLNNSGSSNSGGGSSSGGSSNSGGTTTPTPTPTPMPTPEPTPEPEPTPTPTPEPSEPNGLSGSALNSIAESYGWVREDSQTFLFNGRSGKLGLLYIDGNNIDLHANGYSSAFESTLYSTFNAIIPNGTDKVMSLIQNGQSGSFTANNRSVTVYSSGYVEIR